jgi:hypothetical protein
MRPKFILRKKNKTKSHPLFRLVTEQCMEKKWRINLQNRICNLRYNLLEKKIENKERRDHHFKLP